MRALRRWLITGLVVLLPVIVTGYVLWFGFNLLDGFWRSLEVLVLGHTIPGLGALLTVVLTMAVGVVAANVIGRQLIGLGERILERIPLVRSIYATTKQIVDVFAGGQKQGFQRVVLIEYPRRGMYSVGFLTAPTAPRSACDATGEELWCVFVATSPNPTSGWVVLVPRSQCRVLDMSLDEAFRLVISGGVSANQSDSGQRRPAGSDAPRAPVTRSTDQATGSS